MSAPIVTKATPVLFVDAIEPSLAFWQERLGFERSVEVPEGNHLAFVILSNGSFEIMYQTIASMKVDVPAQAARYKGDKSFLFLEVQSIDAVEKALEGYEIVMPRRESFYGATEIGYREPGGHSVTFAQFKQ